MVRLMLLLLLIAPLTLTSYADSGQKTYTFKVSKDMYESIKVDANKGSETFSLSLASSGKKEGDSVYDFKKNLTMIRLPKAKGCFLRYSIGNVPRPADLLKQLQLVQKSTDSKTNTTSEENFKVVGKLRDRSDLSDEMKDLCAKLPIYRLRKLEKKQNDDADQMEDDVEQSDEVDDAPERVARGLVRKWVCRRVCKHIRTCVKVPRVSCSWRGCKTSWRWNCWIVKTICPYACYWALIKLG